MILALGLVTSISILAISHILLIVPALYFIPKTNFKALNKSAWALIALTITLILSVLVNQDISVLGYKPITKIKYFIFGFLAIAPFSYFFKNNWNDKKIKYLIYAFCISTTIATCAGLIGLKTGINPITFKEVDRIRNAGVFGMVMNYAHNLSYFLVIILGMIVYHKKLEKFISLKFLLIIFAINLIGLFASFTRGAWLGFLVGVPFFFFKNNKKWFALSGLIMIIIGSVAYFSAGKSMVRIDNDITRIGQWQGAIAAFQERPILGIGYLNFEQICSEIKQRHNLLAPEFRGHAHNNFFEILADAGAIGFISFVCWLGFWFYEMYKRADVVAEIALPFIVVFIVGGLTQSTISLGINLFFVMAVYPLTQVTRETT